MPTHFRKPGTKLTPREDLFCDAVVAGQKKYIAFMESHNCTKTRVAQNRATELMRDPRIIQAIEERKQELRKTLIAKLAKMSGDAIDKLYDLMTRSRSEVIQLKAAAELLKASQPSEKVNVEVNSIAQAQVAREVTVRYVKKDEKGELVDL